MPHNSDKKRTNASRACDQCRRKKIKCDRNLERNICTSCQRNGERCTFERVPLKRGPTKGIHKGDADSNRASVSIGGGNTENNTPNAMFEDAGILRPKSALDDSNVDPLSRHGSGTPLLDTTSNPGQLDRNNTGLDDRLRNSITPVTPARSGSILLPPLSQYPQQGPGSSNNIHNVNGSTSISNSNNTSNNVTNNNSHNNSGENSILLSGNLSHTNLQQQQPFWKVPYHEFQNQRRGSIESLQSDLSVRTFNPQDQLVYNTFQQSPIGIKHPSDPTNVRPQLTTTSNLGSVVGSNDLLSGNPNYWGSMKAGSFLPTGDENDDQIPTNNQRRSSSIPSILRNSSTSILLSQPQLPHPNGNSNNNNNSNNNSNNNNSNNNNSSNNNLLTTSRGDSISGINNPNSNPVNNPNSTSQRNSQSQQYSYSQFSLQPRQSFNQPYSSFGQFTTNGFQSRHGSITSEAMSPNAALMYGQNTQTGLPGGNSANLSNISLLPDKTLDTGLPFKQEDLKNQDSYALRDHSTGQDANVSDFEANKDLNNIQKEKRGKTTKKRKAKQVNSESKKAKPNNKANYEQESMNSPVSANLTPQNSGFQYGQILDVELIDLYYEFIHVGFPVIPLNKQTLRNDILLVNTQPISSIHEVNSYVILWFRNSLELLVRVALKRKNSSHSFENFTTPLRSASGDDTFNDSPSKNDRPSSRSDARNSMDDDVDGMMELQSAFITALNECFQRVVDIHPKFRENKDRISPKIKIIYLTTFILLNYILAIVGYDNSFVLGMSVTIFNEFKLYKLLLYPDNEDDNEGNSVFYNNEGGSLGIDGNDEMSKGNGNLVNNGLERSDDRRESSDEINGPRKNSGTDNHGAIGENNGTNSGSDSQDNDILSKGNRYSILFKRLYILLVMFDSLQSCVFGGPKLLNVCITNTTERFFTNSKNSKWNIEESSIRLKSALMSLKLGELLSEVGSNRITMNHFGIIAKISMGQSNDDNVVFNMKNLSSIGSYHQFIEGNEGYNGVSDQPLCVSQCFHRLLVTKSSFTVLLLSLLEANTGKFKKLTLSKAKELVETLCSLISVILQLLTLNMRLNPTNSIDLNYRPLVPTQNMEDKMSKEMSDDNVNAMVNSTKSNSGNEFYRRLLGLEHDNEIIYSDVSRGVISPFSIAIVHESHNIHEMIKMIPTILIRLVMTISSESASATLLSNDNDNDNDNDNVVKPESAMDVSQDLVYKLSNSMNDVVQIASLLNMIKPLKVFEHDFKTFEDGKKTKNSLLKRLYYETHDVKESKQEDPLLIKLINTGWQLLDDTELGYLQH
ncbi:Rgt1p [Nakaseomyces bracarensis]|uniref:Rgt1p n=1 Tax=Nakaseomyces bracarensis TaxID=273131 RepID=UPI0038713D9E